MLASPFHDSANNFSEKKYHNPNHIYKYVHIYNVTIMLLKSFKII